MLVVFTSASYNYFSLSDDFYEKSNIIRIINKPDFFSKLTSEYQRKVDKKDFAIKRKVDKKTLVFLWRL